MVQDKLAELQYDVQAVVLDSQDFALPQHRVRIFFVAVLSESPLFAAADYSIVWKTSLAELESCKRAAPPLDSALLAGDSTEVQAELRTRMAAKPKQDSSSMQHSIQQIALHQLSLGP